MISSINTLVTNTNLALLATRDKKFSLHSSFLKFSILLSNDVCLNPGPCQINSLWTPFKSKGLHFIHLNINSLFQKIDELKDISKKLNAAFIGISESKLDSSINDSEIQIDNYVLLWKDRNRQGGGVVCYIRDDISFTPLNIFPSQIENIFVDILLPKTKPFSIGVFYRPPSQNDFIDLVSEDFDKLLPEEKEIYILGDFNINVLLNGKSILDKSKSKILDSSPMGLLRFFTNGALTR